MCCFISPRENPATLGMVPHTTDFEAEIGDNVNFPFCLVEKSGMLAEETRAADDINQFIFDPLACTF